MTKKERYILFIVLIFVAILYVFLFPSNIGKSSYYFVSDYMSIDKLTNDNGISDGYCQYNGGVVYFNSKFKTVNYFYIPKENELVVSNIFGFAVYNKIGTKILLYDNNGQLKKEIFTKNYPYIFDNYPVVYYIKTNGTGFFSTFITGEPFIQDFSTDNLITSITLNEKLETSISLIDGRVYLLDNKGNQTFNTFFKDSEINVSKNSISDGKYVYTISGINNEYLKIFESDTDKVSFEKINKSNLRYKPIMKNTNRYIYFEQESWIESFSKVTKRIRKFHFEGELLEYDINNNLDISILTKKDDKFYLYIYDNGLNKKYYSEIEGDVSNLGYINGNLLALRIDNMIIFLNKKEA